MCVEAPPVCWADGVHLCWKSSSSQQIIGAVGETDPKKSYAADVQLAMDCIAAENTDSGTCTIAASNNVINGDAKLLLLQWV